jgi:hypothetical protein
LASAHQAYAYSDLVAERRRCFALFLDLFIFGDAFSAVFAPSEQFLFNASLYGGLPWQIDRLPIRSARGVLATCKTPCGNPLERNLGNQQHFFMENCA